MHAFRWPVRLTPESPTSVVSSEPAVSPDAYGEATDRAATGNGLPVETIVVLYTTIES